MTKPTTPRSCPCDRMWIGVIVRIPDYRDLHVLPLLVEPVHAVLPHDSPLAGAATLDLSELACHTWIAGCET